jgi:hypothetical protein
VVEYLPKKHKVLSSVKTCRPNVVAHACNTRIRESEAGGSQGLRLGYAVRPCLKKRKKERNLETVIS